MRKSLFHGLILGSALALGGVAYAASDAAAPGPHAGWHHGHGHHGMFALRKLDLSDAQKASIKQIMQNSFASTKAQRQALREQRRAFESLTPDQAGYQAAADRLAQAEADATRARVEQQASVRAQVYGVLTSAQKMKLASLKAEREQRMQEWKQFRAQHASGASQSPGQ
ncbi:Spy/CpxP family protein refolding chaperone [Fulvimonas sp. R45]|jgi:Spy/CpxP family protein refolding chaperone|uniref:Spy/CpxP family protein refolding chaperone n=1 Tax=Fulvimonas sp. R45 TaxID=3045937 RepID=UPI00265F50CF|nr:Spy/CpxP family protein refolding chaperone [Fulvimonas sp. R45]MDO1528591.1 Spy/CpxP family protein refolding chaperone [Fulvimonas sp. R45]